MAGAKRVKIFHELRDALRDVDRYERGDRRLNLRTTVLPPAPKPLSPREIRRVRRSLNASQALFAELMNVSANTVESWEQGVRRPHSSALKLLHIARNNPEALLRA